MRQRIDLAGLYADALEQLDGEAYDGAAPLSWPLICPFTLDQLSQERRATLKACLSAAASGG